MIDAYLEPLSLRLGETAEDVRNHRLADDLRHASRAIWDLASISTAPPISPPKSVMRLPATHAGNATQS
jgi:hypothetical protein